MAGRKPGLDELETNAQPDPMLREGRTPKPWLWVAIIVIVIAIVVTLVVLHQQ